jgi:hypothetical protein
MDQRAKLDQGANVGALRESNGNGRELMHINVATLGAETLIEFYVVEFSMVEFYVEDSRNETCEGA